MLRGHVAGACCWGMLPLLHNFKAVPVFPLNVEVGWGTLLRHYAEAHNWGRLLGHIAGHIAGAQFRGRLLAHIAVERCWGTLL